MENTNIITLDNLNANNLPELQGWKDKQEALVSENPYIEIVDNKSYEVAKQRRTALLKGRTSIEAQDKLIASKLTAFRKEVSNIKDGLIAITLPHEEKQQTEVKRYEQIKENERLESERLENERIEKIKTAIYNFESACGEIILKMTFETCKESKSKLDELFNSEIDTQEYDILLTQAKQRIQTQFDQKHADLVQRENDRLERERLQREKEEADAKLKAIEDAKKAEEAERIAKENEQKAQMFEIRKNRLAEIGMVLNSDLFCHNESTYKINANYVYESDLIDFENIISDAKNKINALKDEKEKAEAERLAFEENQKKEAERLAKENKERVKRLAKDKEIISNGLNIYFADLDLFTENPETKEFIDFANSEIQNLKESLLTKLNNL